MELKDFLKPDIKKIIVLSAILTIPFIAQPFIEDLVPLLPSFIVTLLTGLAFIVGAMYLLVVCSSVGFRCMDLGSPRSYDFIIAYLAIFLLTYLISCSIVFAWNKFFKYFGDRGKIYEKIVFVLLISLFVIMTIVPPALKESYVSISKNTPENIDSNYLYRSGAVVQKITVKNNFSMPQSYELPGVTAYLYDEDDGTTGHYLVTYRENNGDFLNNEKTVGSRKANLIVVPADGERDLNLAWTGWDSVNTCSPQEVKDKYETLLLLYDRGMDTGTNDNIDKLSENEIKSATKIKIVKNNVRPAECRPPMYIRMQRWNTMDVVLGSGTNASGKMIFKGSTKIISIDKTDLKEGDDKIEYTDSSINFSINTSNTQSSDSFMIHTEGMENPSGLKLEFYPDSETIRADIEAELGYSVPEYNKASWCKKCQIHSYDSWFK